MKKKSKKPSNYTFIDSQNLNLGVRSKGWKLDWRKFRQYLKNKFLRFGSAIPCPSVLYHVSKIKKFSFDTSFNINVDWIAWINLANHFGLFLKTNKILLVESLD